MHLIRPIALRCVIWLVWCLSAAIILPIAMADEPKTLESSGQKYFFPYAACVLCTIEQCQARPSADSDGAYSVQIDRVFRGPFKKGQKTVFSFEYYPELLPKKPLSEMAQQKCVLAFNPGQIDGLCFLEDTYAPFPFQRFTDKDLAHLEEKMDEVTMEPLQLQGVLQSYIQRRWTLEHIRDFCRPELRKFDARYPDSRFKAMGGELNYVTPDIGTANWHAGIDEGGAIYYFVDVRRGKDVWSVASAHPVLTPFTDDDYLTYRVRRTLDSCFESYRFTHALLEPHSPFEGTSFRLVRDSTKRITAVHCKQKNGQLLTVELAPGLSIKSILVDGHPDKVWNAALHDVNANIDKLNEGAAQWSDGNVQDPIAKKFLFYWRMLIALWLITIAILVVAIVLGLRLLPRLKEADGQKYARKPWLIAACLVPPVFIVLQQAIIVFVFRHGSTFYSQHSFWSLMSLSLIIGIVPFMVALTLIGCIQALWKDPTLTRLSLPWFIKRLMPLWLLLFAAWCSLLMASSFMLMMV